MENIPAQTSKRRFYILLAAAAGLVLVVTNLLTGFLTWFLTRPARPEPSGLLLPEEVFSLYAPNVCGIVTGGEAGTGFIAEIKQTTAGGRELYIATNYHVVERFVQSSGISAALAFYNDPSDTYQTAEIRIAGYDLYHDIAVLKVTDKFPKKVRRAGLGSVNDNPKTGAGLLLIGNLSGEGIAAFTGAVSNTDAVVDYAGIFSEPELRYKPVLGVSVNVNGGCSGGPVFDLYGKFAGIGSSQEFESGRPVAGVSYAVPAALAAPLIKKAVLIDNGQEIHKIDLYMDGSKTLELSDLMFSIKKEDGGYQVARTGGSMPYMAEGEFFRPGDKLLTVAGTDAAELSFAQIFGLLGRFTNESKDVPEALKNRYTGLSLKITFLSDGQTKTITYMNKREINL